MKQTFFILIAVGAIFCGGISHISSSPIQAAASIDCTTNRCAECDSCGYCFGKEAPENWEQCRACIYPSAQANPLNNSTLVIDPVVNKAELQPATGKYFTQLGCIDTSLGSFQNAGAAGGVLNFILTRLIFPVTGTLAFVSIIYGAFLLTTAQGDQLQIEKGRRFVLGAIVGALFTFGVVLIINTISSDILRIPGFSKGTPITIAATSSCLDTKGNTETACPILKVQILANNTVIEEGSFGEISTFQPGFHNTTPPRPEDYSNYTYNSTQEITKEAIGNTYQIALVYDNDETNRQPKPALRDKNIYIKSISVGGKTCTQMPTLTYARPGALIFITSNGTYQCLAWQ